MDTHIDENGDLVTYDLSTGDVVSRLPAGTFDPVTGAPYGSATPAAPATTNVTPPVTGATSTLQDPRNQYMPGFDPNVPINPADDPTSPAYRGYQPGPYGSKPPWIAAGYGSFDQWSNAIGAQKAADEAYRVAQTDLLNKQIAAQNGATGASTVNARIGAQTAANALEEQRRQFDLNLANAQTPAERAAALAQNQKQFEASQDLTRGNTLLGLGSRPDTLIKYLYALRGQQTPQGIANTTANLPGYQGLLGGQGGGQSAGQPSAAPAAGSPAPAAAPVAPMADPRVTAVKSAIATPGAIAPSFVAPGGTNITATDPRLGANPPAQQAPLAGAATATQGATNEQLGAQDKLMQQGRTPRFFSNGVAIFKHGGPIPEPVLGVGLKSGKTYEFGEEGPEYVISNDKLKGFMDLLGKGAMQQAGTQDEMGNKAYAEGGTIGYTPSADQQKYMQDQIAATAKANAAQPVGASPSPAPSPAPAPAPSAASALTPVAAPPPMNQPTQADTAMIGGVKTWAGGAYSGMPVSSSPSNAGDLTPYLKNPGALDPTGRVSPSSGLTPVQPIAQPIMNAPPMNTNPGGRSLMQNPSMSGPVALPVNNLQPIARGPLMQPGLSGADDPVSMPYLGFGPGGEMGAKARPAPRPGVSLQDGPQTGAIGNNFAGNTPTLGSQSAGFFNDPRLQGIVSRGYNSNPATPLFPQIGIATNGGQSLIPSAQRLNSLSPAEQSLYSGALQDEFGAQPGDVFDMARRLAPQVGTLRTPKFAG